MQMDSCIKSNIINLVKGFLNLMVARKTLKNLGTEETQNEVP